MLIKCIKSVLWREAKRLTYIQDALCLKVNRLVFITVVESVYCAVWTGSLYTAD